MLSQVRWSVRQYRAEGLRHSLRGLVQWAVPRCCYCRAWTLRREVAGVLPWGAESTLPVCLACAEHWAGVEADMDAHVEAHEAVAPRGWASVEGWTVDEILAREG